MPNLVYIYILSIFCKYILLITFLNEPELIFYGKQLNGFKYFYLSSIILVTVNPLSACS